MYSATGTLNVVFVIELTYTAPNDRIDSLLPDHVRWLDAQYQAGIFLASGRKVPRDGGIILALGQDRSEIEKLIGTDPLAIAGVADYRVTEFLATRTSAELAAHRQELPA